MAAARIGARQKLKSSRKELLISTEGNEENEGRRFLGPPQLIELLTGKVSADGPLQTSPSASVFVAFVPFC
jgi:hypothetical protein